MLDESQRPAPQGSCAFASARAALVGAWVLTGCTAGPDDGRTDPEAERMHLGRVHVLLEPASEDDTSESAPETFEVSARFAYVRGLEEELVRVRIDMPVLPHDILRAGECTPSDRLAAMPEIETEPSEPELVLLDAGDLVVNVGDERVRVPLSLVPDLLPYMSGVEYLYYGDTLPVLPDEGGAPLSVLASGSVADELPPFTAEGSVPAALGMGMTELEAGELARGALVLHWQPDGELLTLRITGVVGSETRGAELTCVVADEGQARFDLQNLRALGLAPEAEAFRVVASRVHATSFDAGDFVGSELVVERRETATLAR